MNRMRWLSIVVLGCMLAGCVVGQPPPEQRARQLDRAQARWEQAGIRDYRIEVLHVRSIWHAQTHTIVVRGGEVVEQAATCTPAPFEGRTCKVEPFDADDYTVAGLFATARALLLRSENAEAVTITFTADYGYPATILFDRPDVVDEDTLWRVVSFEPLP